MYLESVCQQLAYGLHAKSSKVVQVFAGMLSGSDLFACMSILDSSTVAGIKPNVNSKKAQYRHAANCESPRPE
jgi:hypothetical protein